MISQCPHWGETTEEQNQNWIEKNIEGKEGPDKGGRVAEPRSQKASCCVSLSWKQRSLDKTQKSCAVLISPLK